MGSLTVPNYPMGQLHVAFRVTTLSSVTPPIVTDYICLTAFKTSPESQLVQRSPLSQLLQPIGHL